MLNALERGDFHGIPGITFKNQAQDAEAAQHQALLNGDADAISGPRAKDTLKEFERETGVLTVRTASERMKEAASRPIPKPLFGDLWLEGQVAIFFASPGTGKSVLAVQIADAITRGEPIPGFEMPTTPQKVVYLDFELGDTQWLRRYAQTDVIDGIEQWVNPYSFSDRLINPTLSRNPKAEGDILTDATTVIERESANLIILDNFSRLVTGDPDKGKDIKPIMDRIWDLKNAHDASILIIDHTRKRDPSRPIILNDINGSAVKERYVDSAFAIEQSSQDRHFRFLKHVKSRDSEPMFTAQNVGIMEISKPSNYVHFVYRGEGEEAEHLKQPEESDDVTSVVLEMRDNGESWSTIAKETGKSDKTVKKLYENAQR